IAAERGLPPYILFHDSALRQLARIRPSSLAQMRLISGIGDARLRDLGDDVLKIIDKHCRDRGLTRDNSPAPAPSPQPPSPPAKPNAQRDLAFELFREGKTLDQVSRQSDRTRNTLRDYLCEFIRTERPQSLAPWVSEEIYQRIATAGRQVGVDRLKPIFIALGEQVPYEAISIVLADLRAKQSSAS